MSRFVTETTYITTETVHTYHVYGFHWVCENSGYRKE